MQEATGPSCFISRSYLGK